MEVYSDEWAAHYERFANAGIPRREGLYRLCRAFFLALHPNTSILVVGCGTGADLLPLARAFPHATFVGVEPAKPMLEACAKQEIVCKGVGRPLHLPNVPPFFNFSPDKPEGERITEGIRVCGSSSIQGTPLEPGFGIGR